MYIINESESFCEFPKYFLNSILFYTMNILNGHETQNSEFRDCKIRYLIAENKLLTIQSDTLTQVIKIYKQIIDTATAPQSHEQETPKNTIIENLLKQTTEIVNNCLTECNKISESEELFTQSDELFITPQFFSQLVLSYERTIAQLKAHIHHREVILQELEVNKNHPLKRRVGQIESVGIVKAIQSYDIYPKLAQRCRNQIIELKMRKKKIHERSMSEFYGKTVLKQNKIMEKEDNEKTLKVMSPKNGGKETPKNQAMSTFEKVILIYKKKKLFNQILERKLIDLKKKIKEREVCNQILKQKIESEEWENFNKCRVPKNRNFTEENAAYLSILNESMKANNLDFSVDLSKILPPNISPDFKQKENTTLQILPQKILED